MKRNGNPKSVREKKKGVREREREMETMLLFYLLAVKCDLYDTIGGRSDSNNNTAIARRRSEQREKGHKNSFIPGGTLS